MTPELERRRIATEKTAKHFAGRYFSWRKSTTCVQMVRFHLQNMGHRVERLPTFRSEAQAWEVLRERGWESTADMLDAHLERIAPARMLLGDIVVMPSAEDEDGNPVVGMGAIFICGGPGRVFGWHATTPEPVYLGITLDEAVGAWRA